MVVVLRRYGKYTVLNNIIAVPSAVYIASVRNMNLNRPVFHVETGIIVDIGIVLGTNGAVVFFPAFGY